MITITLYFNDGILCPATDEDKLFFNHIVNNEKYIWNDQLKSFKILAKSHGWKVKVKSCPKDLIEDEY